MDDYREKELVSLAEICEEKRLYPDAEKGKTVEKSVYFSSMHSLLCGAISFVEYFENLHREGLVYGSNDAAPFRFDLKTGDMTEDTEGLLLPAYSSLPAALLDEEGPRLRLNEFLAPELIEAASSGQDLTFSMETDWYFMSVVLFEYFFHTGSPFEGKMMVNRCFLSPMEKEMYRVEHGQFCMDIGEVKNTPVKGIQDKLIRYWKEYPRDLQRMFQRAFIDGGSLSNLRPTEVDWKQVLIRIAMDYQTCACGYHSFSFKLKKKENGTLACPGCGKIYYPLTNGMDRILLSEGGKLYACQTGRKPFDKDTVTGLIVENKRKKGLYGIKNISKDIWRGMYPDHTTREVEPGQGIPIWNGMKLRFALGEDWSLAMVQPDHQSLAGEKVPTRAEQDPQTMSGPDRQEYNKSVSSDSYGITGPASHDTGGPASHDIGGSVSLAMASQDIPVIKRPASPDEQSSICRPAADETGK